MEVPDIILDNTSRQRYALMRLFMDKPDRSFSRKEVIGKMMTDPYNKILTRGSREEGDNPFIPGGDPDTVPTILIDRLRELVGKDLIQMDKQGKEVTYKLKRNKGANQFDAYNIKEDDSPLLLRISASLDKYGELPYGELLKTLEASSCRIFNDEKGNEGVFTIVDFEAPFVKDASLRNRITQLHWAIYDCCIIASMQYHGSFYPGKEPHKIHLEGFMPYLLKESKGQWYLVGKCAGDNDFRVIPVNRIIGDIDYSENEFNREPFSPEDYWEGCAGITRYGTPLTISFKVRNGPIYNNIDYIRAIPIVKGHQSVKTDGPWMDVTLEKIHMGPELVRIIRSFGKDNVCDVNPSWLEEDLWEAGRREDIKISVAFRDRQEIEAWKNNAVKELHIEPGGENSAADIVVGNSPNKAGWHLVTLKNVLVSSRLYFFIDKLTREFGHQRVRIRDKSFLR